MVIKYCFQGEIHKTFTPPQTFVALLDEISSIFEEKLPSLFTLQYKDAEGDIITISSDTEYQSMLKYELTRGSPSLKIFVLPNKKANGDKSFEIVSDSASSCSVIERGASEISLSEGKITPRSRSKSPSCCSDSSASKDLQEERVTLPQKINLSQTQEEEEDMHDDTLARLEARAATLKEQIELFYAMADNIENVLQRDQFENSLERAISELESLNGKTPELQTVSISQYQSVENSVLSKEIDEAVEEMTARKLRNIIRRIMALEIQHREDEEEEEDLTSASEPSEMYENRPQALLNLLNIRRRQAKTIKNQAALMIQNAYRGYRLRKMLNNYVQAKPSYLDSENERQLKLTRTKEQISKLIQNTLNHQLADRLQVYKNLRLDCLSEEEIEDYSEESHEDNHSESEDWKLENIQTRDCREESSPSDNGTIFNDEDESADHEVSERKCRQCQDFEYCEHCESFSKPSDDYVRCRLELEDDVDSAAVEHIRYDEEESLQTPDTNLINQVYEEIMQLEAREAQAQGHFDFLVVNDMKSNVLVFSSNEGKKLVYKTICIENTGTKAWRKCYIKSMGQFEARTQEVYNVGVGQVIVVTLEFNDYFYAGPYSSQWKLIHETENGVMEVIGKPFEVDFVIQWREPFNDSFLFKEESQPIEEVEDYIYHNIRDEEEYSEGRQGEENFYEEKNDTIYEDKREEEESSRQDDYTGDVDVTFAKYINYREELARVREIRKIFPEDDLDDIVEFVEQNDEMPMDKLLVTYIRSRNPFGVQNF